MKKRTFLNYAVLAVALGFMLASGSSEAVAGTMAIDPSTALTAGIGLAGVGFSGIIMDEYTEFADAVDVSAAAGTALIGDVINMSEVRDIGNSGPIYLVINVPTAIITGGVAGTVKFQLVSDAQAAIAVDGSATVHFDSGNFVTDDIALADLVDGSNAVTVALPMEGKAYEQYVGILCITATTTTTEGAIDAFLTLTPPKHKSLPDASN